jgi:hypothetical protein
VVFCSGSPRKLILRGSGRKWRGLLKEDEPQERGRETTVTWERDDMFWKKKKF